MPTEGIKKSPGSYIHSLICVLITSVLYPLCWLSGKPKREHLSSIRVSALANFWVLTRLRSLAWLSSRWSWLPMSGSSFHSVCRQWFSLVHVCPTLPWDTVGESFLPSALIWKIPGTVFGPASVACPQNHDCVCTQASRERSSSEKNRLFCPEKGMGTRQSRQIDIQRSGKICQLFTNFLFWNYFKLMEEFQD